MISGQAGILAAIVIYLLAMVYVGFYFSKKGSGDSADDFYLGGRKLGPFVTAMSAEASDMSSWLLMGLPGVAYLTGIADAGWTAIGLAIGTLVMTVFGSAFNAIYLLPKFAEMFGMPLDAIVGMGTQVNSAINSVSTLVLFAVVPFNLLKGVIVSALTFLLYKRISPILHKNDEKMLKRREKRASAADSSAKS